MWKKIVDEQMYPRGYTSIGYIGQAFAYISDSCKGTYLITRCGQGERFDPDRMKACLKSIEEWNNQYSFTINAENVEGNEDTYKILLSYVNTFQMFLNRGPTFFWNRNNKPPNHKVHIIINVENNLEDASIIWDKDKKTVTYNAPADMEAHDWKEKIQIGLERGWTIM